ncbi:MAG: hypothetical protein K0M47_14150 [Rhizobium sp.]|nr:hypothetical protein [Rhizobium sp.]
MVGVWGCFGYVYFLILMVCGILCRCVGGWHIFVSFGFFVFFLGCGFFLVFFCVVFVFGFGAFFVSVSPLGFFGGGLGGFWGAKPGKLVIEPPLIASHSLGTSPRWGQEVAAAQHGDPIVPPRFH